MKKLFSNIRKKVSGQGMVEYGLILALVSIVSVATLGGLGDGIKGNFEKVVDGSGFSDFAEIEEIEKINQYTITFKYANGKLIGEDLVSHGGRANVPNIPNIPNVTEDMWDKPLDNIQSDGVITLSYTIIETAEDLDNVRNNLDVNYIQVADIDLSGIENFEPIGTLNNEFKGTFDGGGYVISNLKIDKGEERYTGLFGRASGATFKNIGLVGVNVTGGNETGGLVGYQHNSSTVINSFATGTVTGGHYTGGLVGQQVNSSVTNSYATGTVTGGHYTGGLVGWQQTSSTVSNSYSTGSVTGTSGTGGGLVGFQDSSSVTNSYATGEVTGTGSQIGGLVGWQQRSSTVTNSYYDTKTTGRSPSTGSDGGTRKSTAEMKNKDTYSGWDESIWEITNGQYPTLR